MWGQIAEKAKRLPPFYEYGAWGVHINDLGGILFLGPKEKSIYLPPYAPEHEELSALRSIPKHIREDFLRRLAEA